MHFLTHELGEKIMTVKTFIRVAWDRKKIPISSAYFYTYVSNVLRNFEHIANKSLGTSHSSVHR